MKKIITTFFTTLLLLTISLSIFAAPTGPDGIIIDVKQSDGAKIKIRAIGDEFYRIYKSVPDGYPIMKDGKNWVYAIPDATNSSFIPSGKIVGKDTPTGIKANVSLSPTALKAQIKEATQKSDILIYREKKTLTSKIQRLIDINASETEIQKAIDYYVDTFGEQPSVEKKTETNSNIKSSITFNEINRAPSRRTLPPKVVGLCVLVDFPEEKGTVDVKEFDGFFNSDNYTAHGNTSSVKTYYKSQSDGKLELTQKLPTKYVTMDKTKEYYDLQPHGVFASAVVEALKKQISMNYSELTVLNGSVISFSIFYAGSEGQNALWPHSYAIPPTELAPGVMISSYQTSAIGSGNLAIGTFCHETGHMVPDFNDYYDYGDPTRYNCGDAIKSSGVGLHCLMGAGNSQGGGKNPAPINAYLKYVAGWGTTTTITTNGTYKLTSSEKKAYRITKPGSTTEYFVIENRNTNNTDPNKNGLINGEGKGWAIWHVDETVMTMNELQQMTPEKHYELSLEQADGKFDLEKPTSVSKQMGDAGDYYRVGSSFTSKSSPGTIWWDNTKSSISVTFIDDNSFKVNFYDGFDLDVSPIVEYFTDTIQVTVSCLNTDASIRYTDDKNGYVTPTTASKELKSGDKITISSTTYFHVATFSNEGLLQTSVKNIYKKKYPLDIGLGINGTDFPAVKSLGENAWFGQDIGGMSARSAVMKTAGEISYFETTLPASCSVTFDWKVAGTSSEAFTWAIYKNGVAVENLAINVPSSSNTGWTNVSHYLNAGTTIRWEYKLGKNVLKEELDAGKEFQGWVKNLKLFFPTEKQVVTIISPTDSAITLEKGKSFTIIAQNSVPTNGVQFISLDPSVATVSSTGVVKAIKAGTATIQALHRGDETYIPATPRSIFVTVPRDQQIISAAQTRVYMNNKSTYPLSALGIKINPESRKSLITFKISDPSLILVRGNIETGHIVSYRPGTVVLSVMQIGNDQYAPATPVNIIVEIANNVGESVGFEETKNKDVSIAKPVKVTAHNMTQSPVSATLRVKVPPTLEAQMQFQQPARMAYSNSIATTSPLFISENEYIIPIGKNGEISFELLTDAEANFSRPQKVSASISNVKDVNSQKRLSTSYPTIKLSYIDKRLVLKEPVVHHVYEFTDSTLLEPQYIDASKLFVSKEGQEFDFILGVPNVKTPNLLAHSSAMNPQSAWLQFQRKVNIEEGALDSFIVFAMPREITTGYEDMKARAIVYTGAPIAPGATVQLKSVYAKPIAEYYRPFETIKSNKTAKIYKAPFKKKGTEITFNKTAKLYKKRTSAQKSIFTQDLIKAGDFQAKAIGIELVEYAKVVDKTFKNTIITRNMVPPKIDTTRVIIGTNGAAYVVLNAKYMGTKPQVSIETLINDKLKTKKLSQTKEAVVYSNPSNNKLEVIIPYAQAVKEGVYIYKLGNHLKAQTSRFDIVADNGVGLDATTLPLDL